MSPAFDWRLMVSAVDHDRRAQMHRPTDPSVVAGEIRRLRQTGLTARDVAALLRLDLGVVLAALRAAGSEPQPRGSRT